MSNLYRAASLELGPCCHSYQCSAYDVLSSCLSINEPRCEILTTVRPYRIVSARSSTTAGSPCVSLKLSKHCQPELNLHPLSQTHSSLNTTPREPDVRVNEPLGHIGAVRHGTRAQPRHIGAKDPLAIHLVWMTMLCDGIKSTTCAAPYHAGVELDVTPR